MINDIVLTPFQAFLIVVAIATILLWWSNAYSRQKKLVEELFKYTETLKEKNRVLEKILEELIRQKNK
jgi:hypothetical protein